MSTKKSDFGVFGLGVMGSSISLNIADKGYELSVFNRAEGGEEEVVSRFLSANSHRDNIQGFTDLKKFIASMAEPRKMLIMIKAGPTVDLVLNNLFPLLSKGDIIIDGGNSHYLNTKRRFELAQSHGIEFIGAGISGGEEGARKGPSIMPGGSKETYDSIAPFLNAIAAKDKNNLPCCTYIGPEGSGHFVKMVHNGIEYAEMQLLSEIYSIGVASGKNPEEIANQLSAWKHQQVGSYLLDNLVFDKNMLIAGMRHDLAIDAMMACSGFWNYYFRKNDGIDGIDLRLNNESTNNNDLIKLNPTDTIASKLKLLLAVNF